MITLSENGKWKNGKTGILSKDKGYFRLRFIEMNNSMDKYIHSHEERLTKCPIIATGFLAYLIETLQTDNNISSIDIYEKYFNYQYQSYLNKVKILPNYDENEAKIAFIKTYIKDEKNHIEKSKTLYDYLSDDKANLIKKYIENYFRYLEQAHGYKPNPKLHFNFKYKEGDNELLYRGLIKEGYIGSENTEDDLLFCLSGKLNKQSIDDIRPIDWKRSVALLGYFIDSLFLSYPKKWKITAECFTIDGVKPKENSLKNAISKVNKEWAKDPIGKKTLDNIARHLMC